MLLFEEKDLLEIVRNTLKQFNDTNLESEAAREVIARKIKEGVKDTSGEIDNQQFFSGHQN